MKNREGRLICVIVAVDVAVDVEGAFGAGGGGLAVRGSGRVEGEWRGSGESKRALKSER